MNDKELLELAGKADNINLSRYEWNGHEFWLYAGDNTHWWNPLKRDGDALRLASSLSMDIFINQITVVVQHNDIKIIEDCTGKQDRSKATRRAIVRCAAEIGKGK